MRFGETERLREKPGHRSHCDDDLRHVGRVRRREQLARLPGHRPTVVLSLLLLPVLLVAFLRDVLRWAAGLPGLAGLATLAERVPWRAGDFPATADVAWDRLMRLSGWQRPAVASAVLLVLLLVVAYLARLARLRWLARRQGPIEVHFEPTGDCPELAEELRTCFLVELAETELYGVSLLPGNRPQERVTDHLVEVAKAGNLFRAIFRLTRMAWPDHAYRVKAIVRERPGERESKGAVVVLEVLTNNSARRPVALWDSSQDRLIRRAARVAAAQIIPWVSGRRMKRMAAWVEWIDRRMPDELLDAYLDGKQRLGQSRYEEALEFLYNGLRADPDNLQIRLDIAAVFEKLSLWPDALNMYQQVQLLARRRLELKQRGWLRGSRRWRALGPSRECYRWRAERRSYRQALMVAWLREIIICSYGDRLAEKWPVVIPPAADPAQDPAQDPTRDPVRDAGHRGHVVDRPAYYQHDLARDLADHLRCRLPELSDPGLRRTGEGLVNRLGEVASPPTAVADRPSVHLPRDPCGESDPGRLGWFLAGLAHHRATRLVSEVRRWWWCPWSWRTRIWLKDLGSGIRSLRLICLIARMQADRCAGSPRRARNPPTWQELDGQIGDILFRMPGPRAAWIDHYNAACAYGVALRLHREEWPEDCPARNPPTDDERKLTDSALRHLMAMVECMDITQLPNYVPWFRTEDPYLDALRTVPEFQRFVDLYVPVPEPRIRRPTPSREYENAIHAARIGSRFARGHEGWWRDAADSTLTGSPREIGDRWRTECEHWDVLAELVRNHQHWKSRLDLITTHRRWSHEQRRERPEEVHPAAAVELAGEPDDVVGRCAGCTGQCAEWVRGRTDHIRYAFERLDQKVRRICERNREHDRLLVERLNTGRPVFDQEWRRLCRRQAELWQLIGEFLDDPERDHVDGLAERVAAVLGRPGLGRNRLLSGQRGAWRGPLGRRR